MFRQALTASLAWTPIESPWTLPGGLPGEAQRSGRPASRRTSWLAASEIASPIRAGSIPSASAAATASAAAGGLDSKIVLHIEATHSSPGRFVPGDVRGRWCWSNSRGSRARGSSVPAGCLRAALALDAVADRLAEHRVGLFPAHDVEQLPGAIGQDDAVDLGLVLDGDQQAVERLVGRAGGDRGEGALGLVHVLPAHGVAERLARVVPGREHARLDRVQHLRGTAAVLLDPVRVAVEDLEHRQRASVLGQLARHVIGGREGHQGVEADVVLAAEGPRVGQRRGGHELLQVGPGVELLDQHRHEPARRASPASARRAARARRR